MTPAPTILSIGDTVVDAFIELIDAHVTCKVDTSNCILYGVGNSANAAVSGAKLGIRSVLLTHLGQDDNGDKSVQALADAGVNTNLCLRDSTAKTNYHYVLWYKPERTILVKHEQYNYNFPIEIAKLTTMPDWVYLSSLGGGTEQYHDDMMEWVGEHPDINIVFQPGTFQMKLGRDRLAAIYSKSNLFFCNIDEAERILDLPESGNRDHDHIKTILASIYALGPKVVVLTDGPAGAYLFDGDTYLYCPMYPDCAPPLERTGAGDAYASTFTAFYAQGLSIRDCMMRAPINSMNVVQHVGAQAGLLTLEQLSDYLAKAPEDYKVVEI